MPLGIRLIGPTAGVGVAVAFASSQLGVPLPRTAALDRGDARAHLSTQHRVPWSFRRPRISPTTMTSLYVTCTCYDSAPNRQASQQDIPQWPARRRSRRQPCRGSGCAGPRLRCSDLSRRGRGQHGCGTGSGDYAKRVLDRIAVLAPPGVTVTRDCVSSASTQPCCQSARQADQLTSGTN